MPDNPQFGAAQAAPPPAPSEDGAFWRALLYGLIGSATGVAVYAGFAILTKIDIGYTAPAVGFIVARAMMMGSKGIGGRQYQITAVILTYAALSLALIPIWRFEFPESFTALPLSDLIQRGLIRPFHELQWDTFRGIIAILVWLVGMTIAWKLTAGRPRNAL